MATGGYKAAEWVFTLKTEDSAAGTEANVKLVLQNVCNLIIQCEPHWTHDAEYTATETDFIKIGSGTTIADQEYAHFLINTVTGSRLLVCYTLGRTRQLNTSCLCGASAGSGYYATGLCVSMIPGGSAEKWDISEDCTTASFIPNTATLIMGCGNMIASSGYTSLCRFYNSVTTYKNERYVVIAKEDLIFIFLGKKATDTIYSSMCIGKIFGQLCNEDDNQYYSKYGAFVLSDNMTSGCAETSAPNESYGYLWLNSRNSERVSGQFPVTYFKSVINGRPLTYQSPHVIPEAYMTNFYVSSGLRTQSVTSGKTAFCALLISHSTDDAGNYGVVPGNCFKGYLDTDFFRNVYCGFKYDTLFDGGNFIYAGGGIALGWDPSNTITLRG